VKKRQPLNMTAHRTPPSGREYRIVTASGTVDPDRARRCAREVLTWLVRLNAAELPEHYGCQNGTPGKTDERPEANEDHGPPLAS
jgi:hypothetical protein